MHDELIFVSFSEASGASRAWIALEEIHEGWLFRLADILLISRDRAGSVAFQPRWKLSIGSGDQDRQIPRLIAEALFTDSAQVGILQLSEAGLDKMFLQDVVQALKPDTSAFLIFVPEESLIDTRRYLTFLPILEGTPHHTIFPSAVTTKILEEGWHMKDDV